MTTSMRKRISMQRWRRMRVRSTDPVTSAKAIEPVTEVSLNRKQQSVLEALRRLGGRACDQELVYQYQMHMPDLPLQSESGLRTRRKELVTQGRVADIGLRVYTESGREAIVWSLVLEGQR